jgi:hypothetical protein
MVLVLERREDALDLRKPLALKQLAVPNDSLEAFP